MKILLGPVLQFRGVTPNAYRVCALIVLPLNESPPTATLLPFGTSTAAQRLADLPFERPTKTAWRYDFTLPRTTEPISYTYTLGTASGHFHVPGQGESPRMAYASCNGFSDPKLMKQVANKNERWQHMASLHARQPYHLLLMGGDQIYSDDMWRTVRSLDQWTDLDRPSRNKATFTTDMRRQVDSYFADLYIQRWSQPEPQAMLSSIPTIMMWDDHDIMDGWGSYPLEVHTCPVYQGIFEIAKRYFRVFQWHCADQESHPCAIPGQTAFSLGFTGLGNLALLVPDLRSERQPALDAHTPDQIIAPASWNALYTWLDQANSHKHLLLMSSIPVAYLDLGKIERLLTLIPGQQSLEDDLRDHWRSVPHLQERLRLIHRLLDHAQAKSCRITILSGDVHVGALSVIESTRSAHSGPGAVINQLVSTGIVHPAPPTLARYVLESMSGEVETIDRGITASMQSLLGNGRYLIGSRNWLALEPDGKNRLWAHWHLEGQPQPLTKVIHG